MTKPVVFQRRIDVGRFHDFIESEKSEFVYVRGRRRVGKSWLLQDLAYKHSNVFYFSGTKDIKAQNCLRQFVLEWSEFAKDSSLKEIRSADIHWKRIFDQITHFAGMKNGVVLIFDEIQWIAKEGNGFVGKLKEAWISWEKTKKIKVIICGSSNRFFEQKSGGEEKILRGLRTQSDITIMPIPFEQVSREHLYKWQIEEAALAYMMTGGVPYYLNQIDGSKSFIPAINDAFFTMTSIFINEVDEVLNIDFNKKGLPATKEILSAIGNFGATQATIVKKTHFADSTVSDVLDKLVNYKIISRLDPSGSVPKKNTRGCRYIINDFFIATYFTLILPIKNEILHNKRELLFSKYYLDLKQNYYIKNFTGYAFERLVKYILDERDFKLKVFKKLDLRGINFGISQYWDEDAQIDIIVEDKSDRISRAIEVKWITGSQLELNSIFSDLVEKDYPVPKGFSRRDFLIIPTVKKSKSKTKSKSKSETKATETIKELKASVITLEDFI
jgi:AAA+ ATPase superfamily predicted ATPase